MLRGVETEAVNADTLEGVQVVFYHLLNVAVARVEVSHADLAVDELIT